MAPMSLWQNSTPFFGVIAFCTTIIDDFRGHYQKDVPKNDDVPENDDKTRPSGQ